MKSFKAYFESTQQTGLPINGGPLNWGEAIVILSNFYDMWKISPTMTRVVYGGRAGVSLQETENFLENRVNPTVEHKKYAQSSNFLQDPSQLLIPVDKKLPRLLSKMVKNKELVDEINADPQGMTDLIYKAPIDKVLKAVFNAYQSTDPAIRQATTQWPKKLEELVAHYHMEGYDAEGILRYYNVNSSVETFLRKTLTTFYALQSPKVIKQVISIIKNNPDTREFAITQLNKQLSKNFYPEKFNRQFAPFIKAGIYNEKTIQILKSYLTRSITLIVKAKYTRPATYEWAREQFKDYISIIRNFESLIGPELTNKILETIKKLNYEFYYKEVIMRDPNWQPSADDSDEEFGIQASIF